jgi:hypothetical protein
MTTAELLEATKAALTPDTWVKGNSQPWVGDDACLAVAFLRVTRTTWPCTSMDVLADVIREQYPDRIPTGSYSNACNVFEFNDHPDTTLADVHAVIEKAIAKVSE